MSDERREHLIRFYSVLDDLEQKIGGARTLAASTGRMGWPTKGIYFFREPGEFRTDTGSGPRTVRIGTHGVYSGARRRLWDRLREDKGRPDTGGGSHRNSIFRNMVGAALINRDGLDFPSWGKEEQSRKIMMLKLPNILWSVKSARSLGICRFSGSLSMMDRGLRAAAISREIR